MITKFKIFESVYFGTNLEKMKVGDYVFLLRAENPLSENKIGKLIRVRQHYNEIDIDFGDGYKSFGENIFRVKYWSTNKEELEAFIAGENYNL